MKMVKRRFVAVLMAAAVLLATGVSNNANVVQAAESENTSSSTAVLENFEPEEIEDPVIEVPEIVYNVEGHEKLNETFSIEGIQTLDMNDEQDNTDPNYAIEILNGEKKTNSLLKDENRWYYFTLDTLSNLTLFLDMDDTIDADLYVFQLNTNSGELSMAGSSTQEGAGEYEAIGGKAGAGVYFIAVSGFEGSGNFELALYTSTDDVQYENNDTPETATEVSGTYNVNGLKGVIDSPYDVDFYKLTLSEASAVRFEIKTSQNYAIIHCDGKEIQRIKKDLYALEAGTHYFLVGSLDGSYSSSYGYGLYITTIAPISTDTAAECFAVCDRANVIFQFRGDRSKYYVNGNEIDFSYSYSNSTSSVNYDISLRKTPNFYVCLVQTDGTSQPLECQQTMPDVIRISSSAFTGIKDKYVLMLSVRDVSTPCYSIHVRGRGDSSDKTLWEDLHFANVYIDPDTGKVIDIAWYNYFYDYLNYKFSFSRPYPTKYYYPYWNGSDPEGGDD